MASDSASNWSPVAHPACTSAKRQDAQGAAHQREGNGRRQQGHHQGVREVQDEQVAAPGT